jgi:hypothetical protein
LILNQYQDNRKQAELSIIEIVDWRIISTDNILIALLAHNFDHIAIQNMGYYSHLLKDKLFIFSMMHGNNVFI